MNEQKPGTIFGRNPLLFYLLVQAGVGLIVSLGFNLSGDTVYYIMMITNLILTLLANSAVVPITTAQEAIKQALYTPVPLSEEEARAITPAIKK